MEDTTSLAMDTGVEFAQTLFPNDGADSAARQPLEAPARNIPEEEMAQANLGPLVSEEALASDLRASGWCHIVAENLDE